MMPIKRKTQRLLLKHKLDLESKLDVKLNIRNEEVDFIGEQVKIYAAEKVIEAVDRNFSIEVALLLLYPEYILENIPIKNFTRKTRDLKEVRARIIGTEGKSLKTLTELSGCHLSLNNNTLSIIGEFEKIKEAENAVTNLIQGSKHSKIFSYLEKARKKTPLKL
jgi:KH domain-containing protein